MPVTIVRPASVAVLPRTPAQRERQREANHLAHRITEVSRDGGRVDIGPEIDLSLCCFPEVTMAVREIIRDAPGIAATPPAGAVRIGRNNRGRVVVAVLHTPAWSLLLCPAEPNPAALTFLDEFGSLPVRFYGNGDLLNVQ